MTTYKSDLKKRKEKADAENQRYDHLGDIFRNQNIKSTGAAKTTPEVKAAAARELINLWVGNFTPMYVWILDEVVELYWP